MRFSRNVVAGIVGAGLMACVGAGVNLVNGQSNPTTTYTDGTSYMAPIQYAYVLVEGQPTQPACRAIFSAAGGDAVVDFIRWGDGIAVQLDPGVVYPFAIKQLVSGPADVVCGY